MNFIMIQSSNTINYCLDAISELNQFSVQNKSIDFASSERRESAWRVHKSFTRTKKQLSMIKERKHLKWIKKF